ITFKQSLWFIWHPVVWLFYVAAGVDALSRLLNSGLHRKREELADAMAIKITKDPLSLAQALYKISQKYMGGFDIPVEYFALLILNPRDTGLKQKEGFWDSQLFSTHPPLLERLDRLTSWAKTDLGQLL